MLNERIAEIRARLEAATPGPWRIGALYSTDVGRAVFAPELELPLCAVDRTASGTRQEVEDACFIAHSWQDIRDLLAEVEQLQAYSDKQYAIIVARDEQLQALE